MDNESFVEQPLGDRSPLHERALTLKDMTVGREFVAFNIYGGCCVYEVRSTPFKSASEDLYIALREVGSGRVRHASLGDLGVTPYSHRWNEVNFAVDPADQDSLPDPLGWLAAPVPEYDSLLNDDVGYGGAY